MASCPFNRNELTESKEVPKSRIVLSMDGVESRCHLFRVLSTMDGTIAAVDSSSQKVGGVIS